MKFRIKVKSKNGEWWEDYDVQTDDAEKWARLTVASFNATLKPFEAPRELIEVEITSDGNEKFHDWSKLTAGMSVNFRGYAVDLMRCNKCGITGKRRGLSGTVIIDSKYRKKSYRNCDTARKEMEFRGNL
ncbi:MAG: hypothetical protein ABIE47_06595 [Pseudomonadota bacterium]